MSWVNPTNRDDWRKKSHWDEYLAATWKRFCAAGQVGFGVTAPYGPPPELRVYSAGPPEVSANDIQSVKVGDDHDPDPSPATAHLMGARTVANMQARIIASLGTDNAPGQWIDASVIEGVVQSGANPPFDAIRNTAGFYVTEQTVAAAIGLRVQDHSDPTTTADPSTLRQLFERRRRREIYSQSFVLPFNSHDDQWSYDYGTSTWVREQVNAAAVGQRANFYHTFLASPASPDGGGVQFVGVVEWDGTFWQAVTDPTIYADELSSENDPTGGSWCAAGWMQPGDFFGEWLWVQLKAALQKMDTTAIVGTANNFIDSTARSGSYNNGTTMADARTQASAAAVDTSPAPIHTVSWLSGSSIAVATTQTDTSPNAEATTNGFVGKATQNNWAGAAHTTTWYAWCNAPQHNVAIGEPDSDGIGTFDANGVDVAELSWHALTNVAYPAGDDEIDVDVSPQIGNLDPAWGADPPGGSGSGFSASNGFIIADVISATVWDFADPT